MLLLSLSHNYYILNNIYKAFCIWLLYLFEKENKKLCKEKFVLDNIL